MNLTLNLTPFFAPRVVVHETPELHEASVGGAATAQNFMVTFLCSISLAMHRQIIEVLLYCRPQAELHRLAIY